FSNEFEGADWLDEPPREGARFKGRNKNERIGEWEVTCHVTSYEPNKVFAWAVGDVEKPAATWEFRLTPLAGATRLRFAMVLGPGPSGLTRIIEQAPDSEKKIISNRLRDQHVNMRETVEGIKKLAEKN
ncbi:MAG: SRPBCC family protein, partial [Actinomycetota bacterium]|nr:SRPBCC family protein [Actinomycetota bacterium]